MFFSISTEKFDNRFVNHKKIKDYYVSVDDGWYTDIYNDVTILYKGYCDEKLLSDAVKEFFYHRVPVYNGNFCAIVVDSQQLHVLHDLTRSFPLVVYENKIITNFPDNEFDFSIQRVWSDSLVSISKRNIDINYINNIPEVDYTQKNSLAACVSDIALLLAEKSKQLGNFESPIKVFLSGGVDTMMVYSVVKKCVWLNENGHELVVNENFDLTEFTAKNYQKINHTFWGYRQIHHWKQKSIFATGACGDEIFMRGPSTAALWCAWHDYNLIEILDDLDYSYHKKYFTKEKNKTVFNDAWKNRSEIQKLSYQELCEKIVNNIFNDHQHWHIENTLTWTPLKDIRILQNILKLPTYDLLQQILHGSLDRAIISQFDPELNNYICTHKNYNQYHNLLNYPDYKEKINA